MVHDLNLAARYADQVTVLDDGRAVMNGRPDDVLTEPVIERHFNLSVSVQRHPSAQCPLIIPH